MNDITTTAAYDHLVDARHQPCPMPILMLKRALKHQPKHHIFLVKSTDANSQQDLIHFCQIQHLNIVQQSVLDNEFHYYIQN